jgi:hypothetical protein
VKNVYWCTKTYTSVYSRGDEQKRILVSTAGDEYWAADTCIDSIGAPDDIPPFLIMAETDNLDLDLVTHKETIHRALNNPLDTKTEALMQ